MAGKTPQDRWTQELFYDGRLANAAVKLDAWLQRQGMAEVTNGIEILCGLADDLASDVNDRILYLADSAWHYYTLRWRNNAQTSIGHAPRPAVQTRAARVAKK